MAVAVPIKLTVEAGIATRHGVRVRKTTPITERVIVRLSNATTPEVGWSRSTDPPERWGPRACRYPVGCHRELRPVLVMTAGPKRRLPGASEDFRPAEDAATLRRALCGSPPVGRSSAAAGSPSFAECSAIAGTVRVTPPPATSLFAARLVRQRAAREPSVATPVVRPPPG
jgi:hypothetical protein